MLAILINAAASLIGYTGYALYCAVRFYPFTTAIAVALLATAAILSELRHAMPYHAMQPSFVRLGYVSALDDLQRARERQTTIIIVACGSLIGLCVATFIFALYVARVI